MSGLEFIKASDDFRSIPLLEITENVSISTNVVKKIYEPLRSKPTDPLLFRPIDFFSLSTRRAIFIMQVAVKRKKKEEQEPPGSF